MERVSVIENLSSVEVDKDSLIISKVITPFLEYTHLENAINTCEIFDLDAVIGIRPRDEVFFRHNGKTLIPLRHNDSNYDKDTNVKILIEAQQIYSEAGSFLVIKKNEVKRIDNMRKLKIGHEILGELSVLLIILIIQKEQVYGQPKLV